MRVTYIGPYSEGAEIAATGQVVMPGETVEVPDELGAALCEQTSNWSAAVVGTGGVIQDPKSKNKTAPVAEEQVN